jgi:hypothetical protein
MPSPHTVSPSDQQDLFKLLFSGQANPKKVPADRFAMASLLVANIFPILLAVFLGWDVGDVVTFYWLENIIIGFWVIARLIMAQGNVTTDVQKGMDSFVQIPNSGSGPLQPYQPTGQIASIAGQGKFFLVPFFCLHYFFFCFVHGVFISVFASGAIMGNPSGPLPFDSPSGGPWPGPLVFFQFFYSLLSNSLGSLSAGGLLAVGGLVISHGVTFFRNYIGHGEYKTSYALIEMFRPYPRIVLLHIGILAGGIATILLGSPVLLVIFLMLGKTILDAKMHMAS